MKKSLFLAVLIILLLNFFIFFAYAANDSGSINLSLNASTPASVSNISLLNSSFKIDKFRADTNKLSSSQILLPPWADNLIRFMFNFNLAEKLTLQKMIILLAIWIMVIILIYKTLALFDIIGRGWIKYPESVIIGLLTAISGGLTDVYLLFFGVLDFVKFLQDWILLKGIIVLLIFVLFFLGFQRLIKLFEKKKKVLEAEEIGRKVGAGS